MQKGLKSWCVGFLFLSCAFGQAVFGEETPIELATDHPTEYIVKSGDTLWDIAGFFLKDPWRWNEVWRLNPDIENPNRIYPGDVISLKIVNGKPELNVTRKDENHNGFSGKPGDVVKLSPKVHKSSLDNAIPTIPLKVIGPFLNHSRVIEETTCAHAPKIVALEDERLLEGAGDIIYVTSQEPLSERNYDVFRIGKSYTHPVTKCFLGLEAEVLGSAILKTQDSLSVLLLTESTQEIRIGDKLLAVEREQVQPYFLPQLPKGQSDGYLISVFGGVSQIGQHQVAVVTGGKDLGRREGDVLAIYRTEKEIPSRLLAHKKANYEFPKLNIGTVLVFKVFDKVSYALITQAKRPIYLHDEVGTP